MPVPPCVCVRSDFNSLDKDDVHRNNELAFRTAEQHLGIPALLDAEDMASCTVPDRLSILTYLSQFYQTFGGESQIAPEEGRGGPYHGARGYTFFFLPTTSTLHLS